VNVSYRVSPKQSEDKGDYGWHWVFYTTSAAIPTARNAMISMDPYQPKLHIDELITVFIPPILKEKGGLDRRGAYLRRDCPRSPDVVTDFGKP